MRPLIEPPRGAPQWMWDAYCDDLRAEIGDLKRRTKIELVMCVGGLFVSLIAVLIAAAW